jgi:hypothetical protein
MDLDLNVFALGRLGESLQDSGSDLAGSKLKCLFKVLAQHGVHSLLPHDRRCHLSSQELFDGFRVRMGHGIDVANDRDAGFGDCNLPQDLFEICHSGLHEI